MKTINKVNQLIKWLEEQHESNNHLFKTYKTFNEYLLEDICNETIEELISLGYSLEFINETIKILLEDETSYPTVKRNKFISLEHNEFIKVIKITYKLTDKQSYTKYELTAKNKLMNHLSNMYYKGELNTINIKRVHGMDLREYIFTYTLKD